MPFLKPKTPLSAEEEAARLKSVNDKKSALDSVKNETAIAKFDRKVKRREAQLVAQARVAAARADFRAKHPNARGIIGWVREHLAGLAGSLDRVSTTTFIQISDRGMMLAIIGIIILCFGLDGFFFGSKAPEPRFLLLPLFIILGLSLRLIVVLAGIKLESLKEMGKEEQRARWTWRILFNGCIVICAMSAASFFLGSYNQREAQSAAVTDVASATGQSIEAQLAALNKQADDIRADLKARIEPLNTEIYSLDHDGHRNEELANTQKARRKELEDKADAKIDAIDSAKLALVADKGTTQQAAAEKQADQKVAASTTWVVFNWTANKLGAKERDVVDVGMLFLALLVEAIAAFGPGAYFGLRRRYASMVRKLVALEANEAAELDREIAQIEARTALAKAAAAAARTEELNDDEAVLKQAKDIEAQAARELELAKSEQRAKAIREEIEEMKRPKPKPVEETSPANDPPELTPAQQRAENARRAAEIARDAAKNLPPAVPVGAWSGRADRQPERKIA